MMTASTSLLQTELESAIIRNPLLVSPDISVMEAIAQMSGIHTVCSLARETDRLIAEFHLVARSSCVLVVEGERLLGILTERDIVRLSAQQPFLGTRRFKQ